MFIIIVFSFFVNLIESLFFFFYFFLIFLLFLLITFWVIFFIFLKVCYSFLFCRLFGWHFLYCRYGLKFCMNLIVFGWCFNCLFYPPCTARMKNLHVFLLFFEFLLFIHSVRMDWFYLLAFFCWGFLFPFVWLCESMDSVATLLFPLVGSFSFF
jgi:hypothetical protein